MIQPSAPPPVVCDVCGQPITSTLGGPFLDSELVNLHDGTTPKDVCRACCKTVTLAELFPQILTRTKGSEHRQGVEPPKPEPEAEKKDDVTAAGQPG